MPSIPLSSPNSSSISNRPKPKSAAQLNCTEQVSYLSQFLQQQLLQSRGSLITGTKSTKQWPVWSVNSVNLKYAEPFGELSGITASKVDLHQRKPVERSVKRTKTPPLNSEHNIKDKAFLKRRHSLPVYTSIQTLYANSFQVKVKFVSSLSSYVKKMGQTLSEPVTKKETTSDENHSLKVGASCMQGWRISILYFLLHIFKKTVCVSGAEINMYYII